MPHTTATITPNGKTRESVQIAGGKVRITARDLETGSVIPVQFECKLKGGYGKNYAQVPLSEASHVFISEGGYGTPRIGTYYPPRPGYAEGRFFPADDADQRHINAALAIMGYVSGQGDYADRYEFVGESRCGLCFRDLKDPVSVKRGIGPECIGKPTGTKLLHQFQMADAGDDVALQVTVLDDQLQAKHEAMARLMGEISQIEADKQALIQTGAQTEMEVEA